jgi:hypothetical protein
MNDMTDNKTAPVPADDAPPESSNILATLLKSPQRIALIIAGNRDLFRNGAIFLLCATLSHAIYGLALGLFDGWQAALMDIVKVPLIALSSLLLCFPSLYVFACVGGTPLTLRQTFALGSSCLALIGLLLVGLSPVAWLFSVSTDSTSFVVLLALVIWFVAICFAMRYIGKLRDVTLFNRAPGIRFWFFIFALVMLQMVTCMRPILAAPKEGWWTSEKKFFFAHFVQSLEARNSPEKQGGK